MLPRSLDQKRQQVKTSCQRFEGNKGRYLVLSKLPHNTTTLTLIAMLPYCSVLQSTATKILYCTAQYFSVLPCTASKYTMLHCTSLHCMHQWRDFPQNPLLSLTVEAARTHPGKLVAFTSGCCTYKRETLRATTRYSPLATAEGFSL